MASALVTGAAGFIGSHLSERLVEQGVHVIGVDRLSDYYDPAVKRANIHTLSGAENFTFIEADLRDAAGPELLDGVERVYHLAGQPSVRPSWGRSFEIYSSDNVIATQALLEAAKEAGLERVVYASSSSVYGDAERLPASESDLPRPLSPYGVTKLAAEHLCRLYARTYGVPVVSLRYFSVYGPRQRPDMAFHRFIRAGAEGKPITVLGDGRQSRDFTYVADVVSATLSAGELGVPGEVYNVAGGSKTTVLEVISVLERLIGTSFDLRHEDAAAGDARETFGDISKARRELGYEPRHSLEEGLATQVGQLLARTP